MKPAPMTSNRQSWDQTGQQSCLSVFPIILLAMFFTGAFGCGKKSESKAGSGPGKSQSPEPEDDSDDGSDDEEPDTGSTGTPEGKQYFEATVTGVFSQMCADSGCHVEGAVVDEGTTGTMGIHKYADAFAYLNSGTTPQESDLYQRVKAVQSHPESDMCYAGDDYSPCYEIVAWWQKEFPDGRTDEGSDDGDQDGDGDAAQGGKVTDIDVLGGVFGTVYDDDRPDVPVRVEFYLDGTDDNAFIGFTESNPGLENFNFELPPEHIDRQEHQLHAFMVIGAGKVSITPEPIEFVAYPPVDPDYYDGTLKGILNGNCSGCHSPRSLEDASFKLLNPPPHKGGSATNNELYNNASAKESHGGGNRCGGNPDPCAAIRTWWEREFN